jgi:hypothetical protein
MRRRPPISASVVRGLRAVVIAGACSVAAACSVLVSTGGLSGGSSSIVDGSPDRDVAGETGTPEAGADAAQPAEGGVSLPPGLLAHYKLDGNARDTSGNGNDGAVVAALSFASPGVSGSYAHCAGGGVVLGERLNMGTRSFSVSAWVRFTGTPKPTNTLFANGPDWTNDTLSYHGYALGYSGGDKQLLPTFCDGAVWVNASATIDLYDNVFHHVVMVLARATREALVYVDGTVSGRGPIDVGNIDTNGDPLALCRWTRNEAHDMAGDLDEVMFFDDALSAASVASIRQYFGR